MISRPFTPLLVATLIALSPCVFAAGDELREANRLYQQGQVTQALDQVEAYLSTKPKDAQARFLKGVILTDQKKTDEAIKVFTGLTEEFPELPEPYNNLAVLYASLGQYERAKIALELAIRTHPSYATAHENLGDIYAQLASRAYDKALQLDKSNMTAQTKLAMIKNLFSGKTIQGGGSVTKQEVTKSGKPVATADGSKAVVTTVIDKPSSDSAPSGGASENDDIIATIQAWAKAWAAKDTAAYLSFYAPDFETPSGETRDAWEKQRKERLEAAKFIKVSVTQPKVSLSGDDQATVVFHQNYQSNTLKSSGRKTLNMIKANGKWMIKSEKSRS